MKRYNIVIPVAGQGSRFKEVGFNKEKPLIMASGSPIIEHAIKTLGLYGKFIFITRTFANPEDNKRLTKLFDKLCTGSGREYVEVRVDQKHLGAAHSASFAEPHINPDWPLIITNCDQYLDWQAYDFDRYLSSQDPDGCVHVVQNSEKSPNHSYAMTIDGGREVTEIVEKRVVSDYALTGVHYWKNPKDFFDSFRKTYETYADNGYKECYVSITYNELIKMGKNIITYETPEGSFIPIGTPDDLENFNKFYATL